MTMRDAAILLLLLVLAGCVNRDGMDGYGVAVGLRRELNRDRR